MIDGYLPYPARISMADGSRRALGRIEAGEEVLGVAADGSVVATPIRRVVKEGRAASWMRIRGTGSGWPVRTPTGPPPRSWPVIG